MLTRLPFAKVRPTRLILFMLAAVCLGALPAHGDAPQRTWTVYIAQDKHLDYNWCGSTTEIELMMAGLLDYYVELAERGAGRWNLDGTLWNEVYRRHRGPEGRARLHAAIRSGQIGYGANYAVLLWGILDTETSFRALYDARAIEQATGVRARTALIMENPGLTWGAANVLNQCAIDFLGRGIYQLRAESYNGQREPFPLFWWQAPNGSRVLVHWDLYHDTKRWGGYAEAYHLAQLAGEKWNAFQLQSFPDRNRPEVFQKRQQYIRQTVEHYAAYGPRYPISSILLLGSGWDNWTRTEDLSAFIRKYNAQSDDRVRLVDARYQDFFEAAEKEIRAKGLEIPTLRGSFGICWEEWAAHLAGLTAGFRDGQRRLRLAEAAEAVNLMRGDGQPKRRRLIRHGWRELLKFAEHDFGGTDRLRAAMSAGARASCVTQATDIARTLAPPLARPDEPAAEQYRDQEKSFVWRGRRVVFEPARGAVTSLQDASGHEWIPQTGRCAWGQFVPTRYQTRATRDAVFPPVLDVPAPSRVRSVRCRESKRGVEIQVELRRAGFRLDSSWLFHANRPWIDMTFRLRDGWTDEPQSVEFCYPVNLDQPTYRYDTPGAILVAGPREAGGDDLPGANPALFAGVTFAAASSGRRTLLLVTPDTLLLRFGPAATAGRPNEKPVPAQINSMPMMNLTGNDHQFGQGGQRDWTFRYRAVLLDEEFDPVRAIAEANRFATPPFLKVPGQPPCLAALNELDLRFPGGPLLAFKTAEDDRRIVLRLWNVRDQPAAGSLKLPAGWTSAARCDGLERAIGRLKMRDGRVPFVVGPGAIETVAIEKGTERRGTKNAKVVD